MTGEAGLKADYMPGNLGFDPLGLKPQDEESLATMQTKELNNGRLAVRLTNVYICWAIVSKLEINYQMQLVHNRAVPQEHVLPSQYLNEKLL